jgi:Fic-DOC domain mobile mystery protein B
MFNQVWKWAGRYRSTAKNMGWEPHTISEGMRNLFQDAATWLEHETYDVTEMAVRMHHRLVVVHPWSNGNGRHARLMADIFVAAKGGAELRWGAGSSLTVSGELRSRYVAALRAADGGDFASLIAFAKS